MPAGDMRSCCALRRQRWITREAAGQATAHLLPLSSVALRACTAFRVARGARVFSLTHAPSQPQRWLACSMACCTSGDTSLQARRFLDASRLD
jgi:hypothetical protein